MLVAACRGGGQTDGADTTASAASDSAGLLALQGDSMAVADTALPEMPPSPDRRRGYLTARAVGALTFTDAWAARGGRCVQPPMLLVIAEDPGRSGASVLLELPAGDLAVEYPVRLADSAGVPDPPAAQLGFQFFDAQRADAYQGSEGVVRVLSLDDRRVSGEFAVMVRHITTDARARVAGAFHQVDVEPLPPDWCERAQAAHDSLAAAAR
jgi:hypothetical protein